MEVYLLLSTIKKDFPNITIFLWTGYTVEELNNPLQQDILKYVDVLIDGRYDENLRDISLHLRGSSNQRIFRTDNNKI